MHGEAAQVVEDGQDGELRLGKRAKELDSKTAHEISDGRIRQQLGEEAIRGRQSPLDRDDAEPDRAGNVMEALRDEEVLRRRNVYPGALLVRRVQLFEDLGQDLVGKAVVRQGDKL